MQSGYSVTNRSCARCLLAPCTWSVFWSRDLAELRATGWPIGNGFCTLSPASVENFPH